MTEASERYRRLRARGLCVNCGRTKAQAPRAYCEACQRRRDDLRRQRDGWQGGTWEIRSVPVPAPVVVAPEPEPQPQPEPEPQPQPRKVVTLRPPHLGREVEFEVVWP